MDKIHYNYNSIIALLSNYKQIEQNALYHSMDHIILKNDLDMFIEQANFSKKQLATVKEYFINDRTQKETATLLGVSQQAILDQLKTIKIKIEAVCVKWGKFENE